MSFDPSSLPPAPLGVPADPAAQAAQRRAANDAARAEEIAAIKEKGFSAYVKEMEDEKLKKMREEILKSMGLTEEQLSKMAPEARAAVEKLVDLEIQKRLAATASVNAEGKGRQGPGSGAGLLDMVQAQGVAPGGLKLATTAPQGQRSSLLSLQEVDPQETARTPATEGKDSRERGRGLPL